MIKNLIEILHALADVHREIYEVSLEKKQAIIVNDAEMLGAIVKKEWELLGALSELEEKRIQAVSSIASVVTKDLCDRLTLDEIISFGLPAKGEAQKLAAVADELKNLAEAQKKLNTENQALIDLHLEYMDYMVNVFLKEPQTSNIYGNSGAVEEEGTENRGIIDSSV